MKKKQQLFLSSLVIALFSLAVPVFAATYYLDPVNGNDSNSGLAGTPWKSFDKVNASVFAPGDIIDGQGNTFSGQYNAAGNTINQLIVPSSGSAAGGYITFQNFTIDGSVSVDGSLSFNPTNTYSNTTPWVLSSGEVYKKNMTRMPFQMFEDGVKLTPLPIANAAAAANLARGQFAYDNATSVLFYRASNGAAPATHALRVSRRDLDGQYGLILSTGKSYVRFQNITAKNFFVNSTLPSNGIFLNGGDHIILDNVTMTGNAVGLDVRSITNLMVTSTCKIVHNVISGSLIEGYSSDLDLSGDYSYNGRDGRYLGTSIDYPMDGDGIGIGGNVNGGVTNLTIHDATFLNNGAPDGNANAYGTGVYVGTSPFTFSLTNLKILRSKFQGNHDAAFNMGTVTNGFFGLIFEGNLVYDNLHSPASAANAFSVVTACGNPCTGISVVNNVFAGNLGNATLYLNNSNASAAYVVQNNVFYNNGRTGTYRGDLWIQNNVANVTESNNHYYRSGTGWDTARVIEKAGVIYDINHILGTGAGYWQFDSGLGANDAINQNEFTNPAAWDFTLLAGAPAIDAGVAVPGRTTDLLGNPIVGLPDIGAYEYFTPVPTFAITVTQGTNGVISPASASVSRGGNQTFTIAPNLGYAIASVIVDGVNQGVISSYTFTNVTATHAISASFVFVPDVISPTVPTGLTATPISSSQINLSWTGSTDNIGVTGYMIYRNGLQIASTTATTYSNIGLTASTTYSYTVAAYDAAGNMSAQTSVVSATTPNPVQTPMTLVITDVAKTTYPLGSSNSYKTLTQQFLSPASSLSGIQIALAKIKSPTANISVAIKDAFNGNTLYSGTITPAMVTSSSLTAPSWITLDIPSTTVFLVGKTYYVSLSVSTTNSSNYYRWLVNNTNPYPQGIFYYGTTAPANIDALMKIGYLSPLAKASSILPSLAKIQLAASAPVIDNATFQQIIKQMQEILALLAKHLAR